MDPFGHPDLERLGRTLRTKLDETLDAEQEAARAAAMRRRTLRDWLIEASDRTDEIVVTTSDGHLCRGTVTSVGVDHAIMRDSNVERVVAMQHIVCLERR